jgi:co-chaperonin GroES (HSP10)|tara:strand:+ start:1048 stop:1305 length:258 start_codon:yes stop_codon:yes gene_type:complete
MKPINKYIIIKPIDEEIKTSSGLLLSAHDVDKFRYKKAKVIKPGTTVEDIKEGDEIYFDKRTGYSMMLNNEKVTIIVERDVVVVL